MQPYGAERWAAKTRNVASSVGLGNVLNVARAPKRTLEKAGHVGANVTGDALFVTVQPIGLRPLIGGERSNHPAGSE